MKTIAALCAVIALGSRVTGAQTLDLRRYQIIDLTHPLNSKTLYWPTSPTGFKLDSLSYGPTPGGWFYSSFAFSAPEHGGTHLDAPIHFGEGHMTVDRVPLDRLIAPAVVIDVTAKTKADQDYRLTSDDVLAFERAHGKIASGPTRRAISATTPPTTPPSFISRATASKRRDS
jgi:kynurenine formamidase